MIVASADPVIASAPAVVPILPVLLCLCWYVVASNPVAAFDPAVASDPAVSYAVEFSFISPAETFMIDVSF